MFELDTREKALTKRQTELDQGLAQVEQSKNELAEYAQELDALKDNMLKERDNIVREKARLTMEKEALESEIKELKREKIELEKYKERELKELSKKKQELDSKEDRLEKEKDILQKRQADVNTAKEAVERGKKDNIKLKEELEEEHIALWTDRNKLNMEVKQFIEDRKVMENELKWQKKEMEEAIKELEKERDEIDEERDELDQFEQELDNMKVDLETRERKLVNDQEDFHDLKKTFLDRILENGSYEHMTPEMKMMAKIMGVDIDEMIEESKRIQARKQMLDKLKKDNDDQLAKIKAMGSKNQSRRDSRRASVINLAQKSLGLGQQGDVAKQYGRTLAVQDYLSDLYGLASTKHLMKDLEGKRRDLSKAKEDLVFANKIIENIRNENKALKREMDIITKIIEENKLGKKLDLNSILGRNPKDQACQTDSLGAGGLYPELQEKIRNLEQRLGRQGLEDQVGGRGDQHAPAPCR